MHVVWISSPDYFCYFFSQFELSLLLLSKCIASGYLVCSLCLCTLYFCNHLDREERAGCFAYLVFLVSPDCYLALPCGAMGLSAVCNLGISLSYSLTIYDNLLKLY